MCYVAIQELATRISHRNTGKLLNDPLGYTVMMRLSTDENHHHLFYRDLVSKLFEIDPSSAMCALERQITNFAMPGVGIPDFEHHAKSIAKAEIYDFVIHYERILVPLLTRHWIVENVSGLNAAAEKARESLINYMSRLGKIVSRQNERRAGSLADAN
jgi:acyl-[acyl-carrier-protein] desaturase